MDITYIALGDSRYPERLRNRLGRNAPHSLAVLGNAELLSRPLTAFFCSVRCSGSLILQSHDLAQTWRRKSTPVVSGFHSPVEKECLTVLLNGTGPIVICVARAIEQMRVRREFQGALKDGRLVFISLFIDCPRRPDAETVVTRNHLVLALADNAVIGHATPGGKVEQLCRTAIEWGVPLDFVADKSDLR